MLRIAVTRTLATTAVKRMDPIQAIFVNKIRQYASEAAAAGGPGLVLSVFSLFLIFSTSSRCWRRVPAGTARHSGASEPYLWSVLSRRPSE